jgi:methenyltetrahydromethanopterin cyclohydrolase
VNFEGEGVAMELNARALRVVEALRGSLEVLRVAEHPIEGGGRYFDFGIEARGGLLAGLELARTCLAGLGEVALVPGEVGGRPCPAVQVTTDHPVEACLGSQYAGWAISEGKFFAMGSGPMRAAYAHEPLFEELGLAESPDAVVGILEGRKPPTPEVFAKVAEACRVSPDSVTLLIAPTASLAGGVQVVARSVETALHKLHELKFDLRRVVSAHGVAPLPPVAKDDLAAIGRTNDSILYGARVVLYVTGDDASLAEVGPQVPSGASRDHGEPFAAIFARYNHDFYAVDPHLFSPAEVAFQNVETGRVSSFGKVADEVLARSFFESPKA